MSKGQNDTSIRLFIKAVKAEFGIDFVTEYKFDPTRRWRADLCCIEQRIIIEVEGGVWTNGRHTRGKGFLADLEKYNTATCQGWRLIRTTPDKLLTIETIGYVKLLIELYKQKTK